MAVENRSFTVVLWLLMAMTALFTPTGCTTTQEGIEFLDFYIGWVEVDRSRDIDQLNEWETRIRRDEQKYNEIVIEYEQMERLVGHTEDGRPLLDRFAATIKEIRQNLDENRLLVDKTKVVMEFRDFLESMKIQPLLMFHKRDNIAALYETEEQSNSPRTRQQDNIAVPAEEKSQKTYSRFIEEEMMQKFGKPGPDYTDFKNKTEIFISWICRVFGLDSVNIISPESMEDVMNASGVPVLVGEGGNGEVRLMRMKSTRKIYAVKTQHWHLDNFAAAKNFVNEVRASRALQDMENFPNFIGVTSSPHGGYYPAVVQEFIGEVTAYGAEIMSLHKAIYEVGISELQSVQFAADVSRALQNMHSKNWLHRDLKTDNILLQSSCARGTHCEESEETTTVKLVDFGTTVNLYEPNEYLRLSPAQMMHMLRYSIHVAPEVVLGRSPYSKSSDIFSLGVVLYQLSEAGDEFLAYLGEQCTSPHPEDRPALDHIIALLDFWERIRPIQMSE